MYPRFISLSRLLVPWGQGLCSLYLKKLDGNWVGYYHMSCNMSFQMVLVVVAVFNLNNWATILLYTVAHLTPLMSIWPRYYNHSLQGCYRGPSPRPSAWAIHLSHEGFPHQVLAESPSFSSLGFSPKPRRSVKPGNAGEYMLPWPMKDKRLLPFWGLALRCFLH